MQSLGLKDVGILSAAWRGLPGVGADGGLNNTAPGPTRALKAGYGPDTIPDTA